jgi:tetratricopeptide (TPR) repeat protein
MVRRGMYNDALRLLAGYQPDSNHPEEIIQKLTTEADVLTRQQEFAKANQRLTQAEGLCKTEAYASCGQVFRVRGISAVMQGHIPEANQYFRAFLSFAQSRHDRYLEATAFGNLGWAALQIGHFDEAIDWSQSAYRAAKDLGAENVAQMELGNRGWAYYQLGDDERALDLFLEAEKTAERLGDIRSELRWINNAGAIYDENGDFTRAEQSERQALTLARQIDSKEDIAAALQELAFVSVNAGKLDEASAYLNQIAGGDDLSRGPKQPGLPSYDTFGHGE